MVSRISGTGLGNSWKFGRLTEVKFKVKKKLTCKFQLSRLKKIIITILTNWKHYEPGWVRYQQDFEWHYTDNKK
jgi:hypothetical protein